jgi:hypothetical protein
MENKCKDKILFTVIQCEFRWYSKHTYINLLKANFEEIYVKKSAHARFEIFFFFHIQKYQKYKATFVDFFLWNEILKDL